MQDTSAMICFVESKYKRTTFFAVVEMTYGATWEELM